MKGAYEGAWEDYKKTVEKLESLNVDVWLQSHPEPNDFDRSVTGEKLENVMDKKEMILA